MKRSLIWLLGIMMAFMTSCEHKDLCYHHPHSVKIKVQFDWTNAPDANPEGMCVFFHPVLEDGRDADELGSAIRFDFRGMTGGEVDLQVGKYRVICYNNDTEGVLFKGKDRFETHQAYTREGHIFESIYGNAASYAPRADGTEDERVVISPDMMWGSTAYDVEVTDEGLSYTCIPFKEKDELKVELMEHIITLYPAELICTYTYEIRNVTNLKSVSQMCASLSGMSGGLYFGNEELYKECVTLPVEAYKGDEKTIVGRFLTFGHHPENEQEHRMLLYVWLDNGDKVYYGQQSDKFNVTDQVHQAPDKRHVHIIIDGLDLPQVIGNGSGYELEVDDWYEIYEDIYL